MSYPYDSNPWDDDPNTNTNPQQQQNQNYATTTTAAGYANPANQFYYDQQQQPAAQPQYGWSDDPYQQPHQQPQATQAGHADPQQYSQQQQLDDSQSNGASQARQTSAFRRFVGAHAPLCGSLMDTCSSINLPFIDALVQRVNKDLLVSKMFYFFFYSAFGSLFPLMGVYFKQLGMNPAQVGILTGVRPFIEIFSAPFWNSLAERFNKRKALLIFSIISWIVFTYSLAHIRPPASACIAFNDTDYELYIPYSGNALANPDASQFTEEQQQRGFEMANNITSPTSGGQDEPLAAKLSGDSPAEAAKQNVLESKKSESGQQRRRRRRTRSLLRGNDDEDENSDDRRDEDEAPSEESSEKREQEQEAEPKKANKETRTEDQATDDEESNELNAEKRVDQNSNQNEPESNDEDSEEEEGGNEVVKSNAPSSQPKNPNKIAQITTGTSTTSTTTEEPEASTKSQARRKFKDRHKTPPTHIVGMSPITVEYAAGYNKTKHSQFVTPMFSTVVYKLDDIKSVFFLLLLLISLGEFFSAPAITLADSATLRYLGDQVDLYCRQRMFGSLSWAVTLLLVGMALDNATSIADHPCGPHLRERSYTVCYMIFSLLMGCALMTATQFRFDDDNAGSEQDDLERQKQLQQQAAMVNAGGSTGVAATSPNARYATTMTTTIIDNPQAAFADPVVDDLYASTQPRSIFNTAPPVNESAVTGGGGGGIGQLGKEKFEFLDKWKSAVFAQRTRELPQWVNVFRQFSSNPFHLTYLFITWFLGCGVGLVFTFLFWHLQDVGGTPTLFGICSVINHISEILAYFFSFSFIKRFGHTRVLSVGLGCNAIRFVYVAFLTNPYYALPFELVQGITHAACFAACCSYMSHKSTPELKNSTQGVMQGLHHGIGRACGTLLGGFLINAIGSRASFALYGIMSAFVLAGFIHIRKKTTAEELDIKVDDSDALGGYGAPQGVPSAKPTKLY